MHCAIYARVSTDEQAEHGVSLDAQLAACSRYCLDHGLDPVAVIRDEGVTSSIPLLRRPAGRELIRLVEDEAISHVVAYEQTRLFRDDVEAGTVVRLWWEVGVTCHLLDLGGAQNLDDPMAEAMYGMRAVMGRAEVRVLRKRVRDAMAHIAASGRRPTGTCYGYRREGGELVVVPEEAAIVRELYRRFLAGDTLTSVARDLTARDVPFKNSSPAEGDRLWRTTVLRNILANPAYVGQFRHRGQVLDGTHEPIIDRDEWDRAQAVIALRKRTGGKQARHFSSLFRCGICGGRCGTRIHQSGQAAVKCHANIFRPERHTQVEVAERKLLAYVWRHTELVLASGNIANAVQETRERLRSDPHGDDAQARLADLATRRRQNLQAWQAGAITLEDLQAMNAPLVADEEALLAKGDPAYDLLELRALVSRSTSDAVADARSRPVEHQLRFLLAIYSYVAIWRDHIEFHYPDDLLPPEQRWFNGPYRPRYGQTDLGF